MRYLRLRNWERFQHYKTRRLTWIKFFVELLDDVELRELPLASRLLFDQLLLLAARYENRIPDDAFQLAGLTRIDLDLVEAGITDLLAYGQLEYAEIPRRKAGKSASKSLAQPESATASPHARPRARREGEGEEELPRAVSPQRTEQPLDLSTDLTREMP